MECEKSHAECLPPMHGRMTPERCLSKGQTNPPLFVSNWRLHVSTTDSTGSGLGFGEISSPSSNECPSIPPECERIPAQWRPISTPKTVYRKRETSKTPSPKWEKTSLAARQDDPTAEGRYHRGPERARSLPRRMQGYLGWWKME